MRKATVPCRQNMNIIYEKKTSDEFDFVIH